MQRLILFMIIVATTFEYLSKGDRWGRFAILPREATYIAELLGVVALIYVVLFGTQNRFRYVRPAYWFIFGALLLTMLAGIALNSVDPGTVFAGTRSYLRAIPWFFVGAVVVFTETDIQKQFRLVLVIALIQVPLAIEQRMHGFGGELGYVTYTGDATSGTFLISSVLSLFLICCLCTLVAFYLRGRLTRWRFAVLFVTLLVPTLINETKGTLIFLPLGLVVTVLAVVEPRRRIRAAMVAAGLAVFSGALFVPVYDYFREDSKPNVIELFTDADVLESNLQKDIDVGSVSETPAGRLDAVLVPLRELSAEPATFVFGLGVGNVSDSALGIQFVGEHFQRFRPFLRHAFASITLELGVFGFVLVLALFWCVYSDSVMVARRDSGFWGAFAAAIAGATAVVTVSMIYKDLVTHISMSFLFWYFSGLVAAHRMRLAASV